MEDVVNVVKALSAETRLRLLKLLRGREMSSTELQKSLRMPRQTLAYHLHVLQVGGLVTSRQDGRRLLYAGAMPGVADAEGRFERFLTRTLDDVG